MARLTLSLLGPFQVTLNGKPVTDLESDRVRALLAYLAVESDRPHRRDKLAGLLWPDWPNRSALTNLRNALSNLRKAIGDRKAATPILLVDRETIQFNPAGDSRVDVQSFRTLTGAEQPASSLEEGIALYRGPFLEGFGLADSAPFEEWLQSIREQQRRQCLTALEQLALHYEQRGDLGKACEYAWRQVDLAPWQEEAHQRLMRLLALSGQRSAALAQYETCRHLLQQELGVEPSQETIALYERIRDGNLRGQPETKPAAPPSNMPVWLTPFVGRQDLLAEIQDRLQDSTCRLLTLVGPGGSGKTRLAVEAAARLPTTFPHGVHFVSLASLQSAENIVPAIAQTLGFPFHEHDEPRRQLLYYLRQKTLLLVLDNFEHLITAPEPDQENGVDIVTDLLQTASGVKIMITSRVALNVQAEHLLSVSGMGYPEQSPTTLTDALGYSAVQLFVQDARRVRPGFEPTDDELAQIVQICRLVQGMPLGLVLAAAWMRMLSPAEIATQLAAHKLDFLEAEWLDAPERQRSMRTVFDYSWRLLSERERQVLTGLSVFRGGFTYPAAHQVAIVQGGATTLRDLMALVNHSMLQRTPAGRYEMHELLRQYAEEKLAKSPDKGNAVHDRHTAYYTTALRRWAGDLQGPCQPEALAEMDAENDNVRAAWSWAVKHDQVNRLADGMRGLGLLCDWRARYKEGEKAFRVIANRLASNSSAQLADQFKLWANALAWQARFNQRLGCADQAREQAHQSLALLEGVPQTGQDVRPECALALQVIGEIEVQLGNCQDGQEPLTQSLSLYRELDDRRSIANCLRSLGRLHERMGNYDQAVQLHRESVTICKALGARRDTVDALLDLFVDLHCVGEHEEAERLLSESLAIAEELGDRAALTMVRYRLALGLMDSNPTESLAILEECAAIFAELGDRHRHALALMRAGDVNMHLGRYDQARALLQESLVWYRDVDNWWGIGAALCLLAELAQVEGKPTDARQLSQDSIAAFRRSGARSDVIGALVNLGVAEARLGNLDNAQRNLAEATHIALRFRNDSAPLSVFWGLALVAAEERNGARAVEFWALVSQAPLLTTSRLYQDVYRKYIAPVTATMLPEVIATAKERGRAGDLWGTLEELQTEMFPISTAMS